MAITMMMAIIINIIIANWLYDNWRYSHLLHCLDKYKN